jgi:chemotaxis protein histidine kinase CheA
MSNADQELPKRPDDVDNELLQDFKEETVEHLETVETALLALEKNPQNVQLVNTIFGPVHSIKGSANYLGLTHTGALAHSLENLLAKLRKGELKVNADIIDSLLKGVDFIKRLLKEIVQTGWEQSSTTKFVEVINYVAANGKAPKTTQTVVLQQQTIAEAQPKQGGEQGGAKSVASEPTASLQDFCKKQRALLAQINLSLKQLVANPNVLELAKELSGKFHDMRTRSAVLGFTRLAEASEFAEKACIGLQEKKIRNNVYALQTLGNTLQFLDTLLSEIVASGNEKSDLRPLIGAFSRIEFANSMAYDPEAEFIEETSQYFAELQNSLQIIAAKGHKISAYEDMQSCLRNLKGLYFRLGYLPLNNLAGALEQLTNMLFFDELELYPRVHDLFQRAIALLSSSFAQLKQKSGQAVNTATLVQEIGHLLEMRKKQLRKKLLPKVLQDSEKMVQQLCEQFNDVEKTQKAKSLAALKKIGGNLSQYLIDKEVEYYWTACQFFLEQLDLMETKDKLDNKDILTLQGTLEELAELLLVGKGEQVLEQERSLRENKSLADRIKFVPGLHSVKSKNLLKQYRTPEAVKKTTVEILCQTAGLTPITARRVIAEFYSVQPQPLQEEHLQKELDELIELRNEIKDTDYDKQLTDIFIQYAKQSLYQLARILADWENTEATDLRSQTKNVFLSLKASARYMQYQKIMQLTDAGLSFLEKISATPLIAPREIENYKQVVLQIAKALPIWDATATEPEPEATPSKPETGPTSEPASEAAAEEAGEAGMVISANEDEMAAIVVQPEPEFEPEAGQSRQQPVSFSEKATPATKFDNRRSTVEGEKMATRDSAHMPGEKEKEELLTIFLANAEEDIDLLVQSLAMLQMDAGNLQPAQKVHEIVKQLEGTANQLNFQDLSLLLMKELHNLEKMLQGKAASEAQISHLKETIDNLVDFLRELKGEEVEPELPAAYFEQEDATSSLQSLTPVKPMQVAEELHRATRIIEHANPLGQPPAEALQSLHDKKAQQVVAATPPIPVKKAETPPVAPQVSQAQPAAAVPETPVVTPKSPDMRDSQKIQPSPVVSQTPEAGTEEPFPAVISAKTFEETPASAQGKSAKASSEEVKTIESGMEAIKEDMYSHTLRVNSLKVDELMNLVGELVVSRASFDLLSHDIKKLYRQFLGDGVMSKEQTRDFKQLIQRLDYSSLDLGRVANELQGGVMQVRMVPMEVLFKRFPRIIRELSKRTGKIVKLEMEGANTELDKIVIEEIADPMLHILRNMVDHGIEYPDERRKKNKPAYGTIEVYAYHEGNQVVIEIADDGRGINCQTILQRAIEQKLVASQDASHMTQHDILNLLYHPGFSMSENVSMASGRGVGMGVVKTNITKIGGTIEIETEVDSYTCFIIKIPLTLAIIQALLVKIAGSIYCIPVSSVHEIVKIKESDISYLEGQQVIRIRGNVIPLLDPCKVFHLHPVKNEAMPFVVVIQTGHRRSGLLVQSLLGGQDIVIKNLADELAMTPGISGATLMGDGTVSLILDISGFMNLAYEQAGAAR